MLGFCAASLVAIAGFGFVDFVGCCCCCAVLCRCVLVINLFMRTVMRITNYQCHFLFLICVSCLINLVWGWIKCCYFVN